MSECVSCRRPGAQFECGVCSGAICKKCDQFLEAGTFSFLPKIPEALAHTHYCTRCHDEHVAPALESYNETMELARGVFVFFSTQKRPPHTLSKQGRQEKIRVDACEDRDETILRLAFL